MPLPARSVLPVLASIVALAVLAEGASAAKPRCAPTVKAHTRAGTAKTIHLRCTGKVLYVQLAEPALHGTVDRVRARAQTLRYTPSPGWYSHGGAARPDAFTLLVENRAGSDRVPVRVDVRPPAPRCDDARRSLDPDATTSFPLRCSGLATDPVFRVVAPPAHGRLQLDQSTGRATYVAATVPAQADRFRYRATNSGGASPIRTVTLVPAPITAVRRATARPRDAVDGIAPPSCTDTRAATRYVTPVAISITCTGERTAVTVDGHPAHGTVTGVTSAGGVTTATYKPAVGYDRRLGEEHVTFTATNAGGATSATVTIDVRPFRFVAFGDSVTAGFGYYGDGSEMHGAALLFGCAPMDDYVNGRCSSNSALVRGDDDHAPKYTSDFGFANNASWAAQFAHDLQGGEISPKDGMFANYAVTGSSPGDWLGLPTDTTGPKAYPDGSSSLQPILDGFLAEQPELVAFTIGANPILSYMMGWPAGKGKWWTCSFRLTWNTTLGCLEPGFVDDVALAKHLRLLYTHLLERTTTTKFVVMPYHLTVPGTTSFNWGWWQLEGGIDLLNKTIDEAVDAVRRARPQDASRLLHVQAQWNPNAAANPVKLARFNYGGASTRLDPPSCVPSTSGCRKGDENDYGWDNRYDCHWYHSDVDGPSHQALSSQMDNKSSLTCNGTPWILSSDTGIHPNREGYDRFAAALENLVTTRNLVPALPDPPKAR